MELAENQNIESSIAPYLNKIICGDSLEVMRRMPDESVNLIITSPPYADQRKKTYGGVHPDKYVEWILPITAELKRVLKPDGSFILNIKEKVVDGERHTYVLELILALKKQGWLWTEEYLWHKRNTTPGKWSNRFRDSWERCLHFNKQRKFKMFQDEVMIPMGDWAEKRLQNLSENDSKRFNSQSGSGFAKDISKWVGRSMAYPTNVLYLASECSNRNHSAAFPESLPTWFIKLFSEAGDVVLDPFAGSGTTCVVAKKLERHYVGIELKEDHCKIAVDRIEKAKFQPIQPKLI
jgi:site-specific DNA-methyltransferase (cytosine-N4-specific)